MNCNIIQTDGLHTLDTIDLQDHNLNRNSTYSRKASILKIEVMGNLLSLAQDTPAVILQTVKNILSINNIFLSYTHKIH